MVEKTAKNTSKIKKAGKIGLGIAAGAGIVGAGVALYGKNKMKNKKEK